MIHISLEALNEFITTLFAVFATWVGVFICTMFVMVSPADPNDTAPRICATLATVVALVVLLVRIGFIVLEP